MKLSEVKGKLAEKEFFRIPDRIYKKDKNYIKPPEHEIKKVFDPAQNKYFRNGEAARWILYDENDQAIGRIAAFINAKISKNNAQPTGSIGFFECIDNKEAAFKLFDTAKKWLIERGMEAMDGPVNFGDRDKFWGLLVDGFYPPNYCVPYNPKYYQKLFEEYGFKNYFNQYTFHRLVYDGDLDEYIEAAAKRIEDNPRYRITHVNRKNINRYAEEFMHVYNNAWGRYGGVKEISIHHARSLLNSIKPILDERLIWFAYFDDEPVAFLIMIPEMNQVFKHLNGRFGFWEKIKFFWYFKVQKVCTKALGLIFGITADHQRKGLEAAIINAFKKIAIQKGFPYKELELNWIGDFNPTMLRIAEMVGCKVKKTHITYRLLFDPNKPFSRAKQVS